MLKHIKTGEVIHDEIDFQSWIPDEKSLKQKQWISLEWLKEQLINKKEDYLHEEMTLQRRLFDEFHAYFMGTREFNNRLKKVIELWFSSLQEGK